MDYIDDIASAAKRLGMAESEIASVDASPHGPVVRMVDGSSYIDIAESTPDAKGQTGLAYFVPPTEKYAGPFPVFAPEPVADSAGITTDETPTQGEAAPSQAEEEPAPAPAASTESPVPVKGAEPAPAADPTKAEPAAQ